MNNIHIEIERLFNEKDDKFYLNTKYLNDVTVSMIEPTKTLTQVNRENKWRGLQRDLIQAIIVVMTILCFPLTILLMVFVGTTEIFRKEQRLLT